MAGGGGLNVAAISLRATRVLFSQPLASFSTAQFQVFISASPEGDLSVLPTKCSDGIIRFGDARESRYFINISKFLRSLFPKRHLPPAFAFSRCTPTRRRRDQHDDGPSRRADREKSVALASASLRIHEYVLAALAYSTVPARGSGGSFSSRSLLTF